MTENSVQYPTNPSIDDSAIAQALSYPRTAYFITTNLYWDCECQDRYIRRFDMPMCEECGTLREEAPPSRINEMKAMSVHLDLYDPAAVASLEEHNRSAKLR